jgi:hypothetical protein
MYFNQLALYPRRNDPHRRPATGSTVSPPLPTSARSWLRHQLDARGHRGPVSEVLAQDRPWARVWRVTAADNTVFFFKVPGHAFLHEVAVTPLVKLLGTTLAPTVVASDEGLGFLLLQNAGTKLRLMLRNNFTNTECLPSILRDYARLQIGAVTHANQFAAVGLPMFGMARAYVDAIAPILSDLGANDPRARNIDTLLAVELTKLTELEIPPTIEHGDFHDGNLFAEAGRIKLLDWGDATISHPFFSIICFWHAFALAHPGQATKTLLNSLAHAYLEEWTTLYGRDRCVRALALAKRLYPLREATRWLVTSTGQPESVRAYCRSMMVYWSEVLAREILRPQPRLLQREARHLSVRR